MNAARSLPRRESVWQTPHWRVAHAFDTDLPGWLVAAPTVHVTSMGELTDEAATEFGLLVQQLSRALTTVLHAEKAYVMFFAEAAGFAHLHVHVVPRMPDQPANERGPQIVSRLGKPVGERLDESTRDDIAARLHHALAEQRAGAPAPS